VARLSDFLGKRPRLAYVNAALVVLILVLALGGAVRTLPAFRNVPIQSDFATYYLAAAVLNSDNPELYRDDLLEKAAAREGVQEFSPPYIYPPAFAALLRPVALLPYDVGKGFWFALNIGFLVLSSFLLVRLSGLPMRASSVVGSLVLVGLFPPVHQALDLGQVSPLLLLLCATSLAVTISPIRQGNRMEDGVAGFLLALAAMVKVFPGVLVPYGLVAKRLGLFAGSILGILLGLILGIFFGGGLANTVQYFSVALPAAYGERLDIVLLDNQSLSAFFMRLLTPTTVGVALLSKDSRYQVEFVRLADNRELALALTWLCSALVVGVTAWAVVQLVRKPVIPIRWAAGFSVILTAPLMLVSSAYYHLYVLLLIPLAVLVRVCNLSNRPAMLTAALLVYLLSVVQRYSNWLAVFSRSPWLVSFGLYAALLLWGAMIYLSLAGFNRTEQ
jgi:hypothetical protein